MADNTVNVGINVTDNGTTAGITKNVQNLKDVLDQAALAAARVTPRTATPIAAAGSATTGRIIAASTTPGMSVGEGRDYGTSRAVGGGTGAGARDFAKESAGLGGVVRLYAIFAANIYAVSTAFEALNKASAADRMLKSSEMLSITMGANLKNIAKNLQEVTDYSLSMQEATQFTNMGISAGLAGKQIENLTKIAKGAASALGRDTGESIRRIITGTAKQEQEILDELGIFIKAKDAYKEYAKKFDIKGGADSLTAQQKVVAYADAVEKAGEKWKEFAGIPDPFSKFKAKGSEALQELLTNINKLIIPIISFLSESSDRIKAILVLVGIMLTRRALPELKNIFTNLFTFDAAKAKAEGDLARYTAVKSYADITAALEIKQAERAAMLAKPMGKPELASTVATAAGGLAATRGIPGGIDVTKLTSAIAAKDLALYESRAQIENKVLTTLEAQVKVSQDKSIVVQKLIDQGLISNKSTETNLILGREGLSIAEKTFASIDANNIQLKAQALIDAELVGLGKQQLVQREQLVALGKAGGTVPLGPVSGSTTAAVGAGAAAGAAATAAAAGATTVHTAATEANTAAVAANNAMKAANIVATEAGIVVNTASITATSALNAALAQSAAAHARLATTMGLGLKESFVVFGQVLATTTASMFKFEAAMGLGARAAQVFGTTVVLAGEAVGILAKVIGRFLGPLMIAYTTWELFGDKIKTLIGINTELAQKQDELEKQTKTYNETLAVAGASVDMLNKKRREGIATIEDIAAAHRVELTSINDVLNAFTAAEDKKKEIDKQKQIDIAKEEARRNKQGFDETAYYLKKSSENIELTEAEKNSYLDLAKRHQDLANSKVTDSQAEIKAIRDTQDARLKLSQAELAVKRTGVTRDEIIAIDPAVLAAQDTYNKAVEKENKIKYDSISILQKLKTDTMELLGLRKTVNEQQSSADALAMTAATEYQKGLDDIAKRRKELQDPTSKIKDVKVEETVNNFKKLFEYTGSAIAQAAQRKKIEEELQSTVDKSTKGTKTQAAAMAVLAAYQKAINSGQTDFKQILEDIAPLIQAMGIAMDRSVRSIAFRPYTDAALAGFVELKSTIDSTEASIKRANMELSDVTRLDSRTKAIQGYSNAEELAAMSEIRDKIAIAEQTKSVTAAQLEFDKISKKKDKEQDPKARKEELAAATKALEVAKINADLTKQQADANNKAIKQDNEISVVLGLIQKKYEAIDRTMAESNARSNAALDLDKARLDSLSQLNAYSERGLAIRTRAMEQDRIDNSYAQALAQATKERSKAQEDLNARIDNDVKLAGTRTTEEKRIEEIYQNKITLAGTANNLAKDTLKISTDTKLRLAEQNEIVEKQNFDLGRLEVLKARELITNDEYLARKRVLELSTIQQNADRERNVTLEAYNKDLEGLQGVLAGLMELGIPTEGTEGEIKAVIAATDTRLASMKRIKDAKMEQSEWDAKQNERQVGYAAVFKSSFDSMGDAIMEFAKTGKLNFKSLINDMIAGLVKLELKMAMTRMMEGMGGFGGLASKAIGFFTGTSNTSVGLGEGATLGGMGSGKSDYAKGGAFDGGIKTFAMGGAFSNSIVSSPTLFKFASGAGLMGEAGPEAIMPLKRDPQGNLGIRGGSNGGGNVEVVVNNFGSEKATTKETTDSKGNRKIEVVIGDLSAGEITRSGSSSQRAIRSTFGMQPQLIRR